MALVKRQAKKVVAPISRCDRLFLVHECPPYECTAQLSPLILVVGGFFCCGSGIKNGPRRDQGMFFYWGVKYLFRMHCVDNRIISFTLCRDIGYLQVLVVDH